jgi:hypothetical protein
MALTSDLKHVLDNVFGDHHTIDNPIILVTPIKFTLVTADPDSVIHEIRKVYLKGRSWKMVDEWNNEWTISTLTGNLWQSNLYANILSIKDPRVKPQNCNLSL